VDILIVLPETEVLILGNTSTLAPGGSTE
jgi:hypothetical protein